MHNSNKFITRYLVVKTLFIKPPPLDKDIINTAGSWCMGGLKTVRSGILGGRLMSTSGLYRLITMMMIKINRFLPIRP